jgi:hypothetical protein
MGQLVDLINSTIDRYCGTLGRGTTGGHMRHAPTGCRTHHAPCSAFGNRGIWLNNADAPAGEGRYACRRHVGAKTSLAFLDSNVLSRSTAYTGCWYCPTYMCHATHARVVQCSADGDTDPGSRAAHFFSASINLTLGFPDSWMDEPSLRCEQGEDGDGLVDCCDLDLSSPCWSLVDCSYVFCSFIPFTAGDNIHGCACMQIRLDA